MAGQAVRHGTPLRGVGGVAWGCDLLWRAVEGSGGCAVALGSARLSLPLRLRYRLTDGGELVGAPRPRNRGRRRWPLHLTGGGGVRAGVEPAVALVGSALSTVQRGRVTARVQKGGRASVGSAIGLARMGFAMEASSNSYTRDERHKLLLILGRN